MATAIDYDDVDDVGDQARINDRDGSMWVRIGNLTFSIAAYKGPKQSEPNYVGMKMKEIVAASKKANAEWMAQTLDQRRSDALELAKRVVANL